MNGDAMLRKCGACGAYGLAARCTCGAATAPAHPPAFSPADKYGAYRRRAKSAYK